jgi:hypothetical protein
VLISQSSVTYGRAVPNRFVIGQPIPRAREAYTAREKWHRWILAPAGHGNEWSRVFRAQRKDAGAIWIVIARGVRTAPLSSMRDRREHGIVCGVELRVTNIAAYDLVELTEAVDDAPAGARGGVLELADGATAMVEVSAPLLDGAERIVFAPLTTLRRL